MRIDIVCKCGHSKKSHANINSHVVGGRAACFFLGSPTSDDECPCMDYKPDNLLHIEKLAKKRKLM